MTLFEQFLDLFDVDQHTNEAGTENTNEADDTQLEGNSTSLDPPLGCRRRRLLSLSIISLRFLQTRCVNRCLPETNLIPSNLT